MKSTIEKNIETAKAFDPKEFTEEVAVSASVTSNKLEIFVNPDLDLYCSIKDDGTRASKVNLFNLMSNPSKKLADMANVELAITDFIAQPIQLESEETGELNDCMRIILVDKDNVGYSCVSVGVTSALTKIVKIFGSPSWKEEPIKMIPKNIKIGDGKKSVLTLVLVA